MKKIYLLLGLLLFNHPLWAHIPSIIVTDLHQTVFQEGPVSKQHPPCSTFKIALSLMGFDAHILTNETTPKWEFQPGYPDFIDAWKLPQTPTTWMKNSCVWYSQSITTQLGHKKFTTYLNKFDYGNQNTSGDPGKHNGLTQCWLSSSLKISPQEQALFLKKLIQNRLPVSPHAHEMTRRLLYLETLPTGWALYGKTGSGSQLNPDGTKNPDKQLGWFIGWLQKDTRTLIVAYYLEDTDKQPTWAGKRAKEAAKARLLTYTTTLP